MSIGEQEKAAFYGSLIQVLLDRTASQQEVANLIAHRKDEETFDFKSALKGAVDSAEFCGAPLATLASKAIASQLPSLPLWSDCTFVSLGTHCAASWFLRSMGLKHFSTPFDWIFSNISMASHAISDDFAKFLDSDLYLGLAEKSSGATHGFGTNTYYRDNYGMPLIYNHHDLSLHADRAYMQRCVHRLRDCFLSSKHKVFFLIAPIQQISESHFSRLHHVLNSRCSGFTLIAIASDHESPSGFLEPKAKILLNYESGLLLRMHVSSPIGPVCYGHLSDQVLLIDTFTQAVSHMIRKSLRRLEAPRSTPVEIVEAA